MKPTEEDNKNVFCFPCARYLHPRIVEPHSKTIGLLNWCKKKDIDVTPINNKDFKKYKYDDGRILCRGKWLESYIFRRTYRINISILVFI